MSAVHNLAALSSVAASWENPDDTRAVNQTAVEGMLDVLNGLGADAPAFVQASSSEIFGPHEGSIGAVDERTPLNPVSPYAESKAAAHEAVTAARERGIRASNLVLFGHTSPLQARQFVLREITCQAAEVAMDHRPTITLRDPRVRRDWGAAADVVRAFVVAPRCAPGDFVIGTGQLHTLQEICTWALHAVGADGQLLSTGQQDRRNDFDGVRARTNHALSSLGWCARRSLQETIEHMAVVDVARLRTGRDYDPEYLEGC